MSTGSEDAAGTNANCSAAPAEDVGDGCKAAASPEASGEAATIDAAPGAGLSFDAGAREPPAEEPASVAVESGACAAAATARTGSSSGPAALSTAARLAALRRMMLFSSNDLSADAADGARLRPAPPAAGGLAGTTAAWDAAADAGSPLSAAADGFASFLALSRRACRFARRAARCRRRLRLRRRELLLEVAVDDDDDDDDDRLRARPALLLPLLRLRLLLLPDVTLERLRRDRRAGAAARESLPWRAARGGGAPA